MTILAIETSCDDTAIAIVEFDFDQITILSNIVNTQTVHNLYGGVFPMLAKAEHLKNIENVYEQAISQAKEFRNDLKIDAIAVTVGPGLEPSLWVGIKFAEEIAIKLNVPIIPVNHMEGHLFSGLLGEYELNKKITLKNMPENAISLLVSGGHTELIQIILARPEHNGGGDSLQVTGKSQYTLLGSTLDDAVGEAFDKVARMLGLGYPGGPEISKLAEISRRDSSSRSLAQMSESNSEVFKEPQFPRPMLHSKNYDFSFSGLKTAVLYHIQKLPSRQAGLPTDKAGNPISEQDKINIAKEFEDAAVEVIVKKTVKAMIETGSTHLLLGGGVAANKHLQNELESASKENNFILYSPLKEITGDNALMIALAGFFNQNTKSNDHKLKADGNLKIA